MQPDLVQINLSAPLPLVVVLPLRLHSEYKVDRRLVITSRTQLVPVGVREWMMANKRYARFFSAEEDSRAVVEPVVTPAARRSHSKKATAQNGAGAPNPAGNPPEKTESAGKDAGFDPKWNVTALRAYATAHKITLTRDDNKREALIDKLRAAGLHLIAPPAEPVKTEPEVS